MTTSTPLLDEDGWRRPARHHLDAGRPTGWWEPAYAAAVAQRRRLPWQEGTAHPWVQEWLAAPVHTPPGPRALVVGCGIGDDVVPLLAHGYEVTALDVSATAIAWAEHRSSQRGDDSHRAVRWVTADLLEIASTGFGPFDLVVEVHTVTWLPGVVRDAAMAAIGSLVAPGGVALAITELATSEVARAAAEGPPWAQVPSELTAYRAAGLVRLALEHPSVGDEPTMEVRMTWQRPRTAATTAAPNGTLPVLGG